MIILDTIVIAELVRAKPNECVVTWLASQPRDELYTTTLTQAEIVYSIALLPPGNRRQKLLEVVEKLFAEDLEGRLLPFGTEATVHYATIAAVRNFSRQPILQLDAMIASIARLHCATIATRDTANFENCGVECVNPWTK